jgi:hypothetical protein
VKTGDTVTLVDLPPGLRDHTRSLFEACIGKSFVVTGVEAGHVELDVGALLDAKHVIWVETKYLRSR